MLKTIIICLYGTCFNPAHVVSLYKDLKAVVPVCQLAMAHNHIPIRMPGECEGIAAEINKSVRGEK